MEDKPNAIGLRELIGRIYSSHTEAGIDQPLLEVSSVEADVIFLTVSLQALSGIGHWILNCGVSADRHLEHCQPIGCQHPAKLSHGGNVVLNVLEHVQTYDRVKRAVGEGQLRHVESKHRRVREIPRNIGDQGQGRESSRKESLRRDMEQPIWPVEEVGSSLQVDQQLTVSWSRSAPGAPRAGKATKASSATNALDRRSAVERRPEGVCERPH
jgi:hypothetical protein